MGRVFRHQKGDFVVERKDMFTGNSFPIWKIEPGRLLLKFEPHGQIGDSVIYKSASVVS